MRNARARVTRSCTHRWSLARLRAGGADLRYADCIARSRPTRRRAQAMAEIAGCARDILGARVLRPDATQRRPRSGFRSRAGQGRTDLRGDARSDRERYRRRGRSDLRASRSRFPSSPSLRSTRTKPRPRWTDPPEPIENGMIDLGRLATDVLYLAIDPYPRKPGAVFEPEVTAADPEDHPFAALKGAAARCRGNDVGKPKRK